MFPIRIFDVPKGGFFKVVDDPNANVYQDIGEGRSILVKNGPVYVEGLNKNRPATGYPVNHIFLNGDGNRWVFSVQQQSRTVEISTVENYFA